MKYHTSKDCVYFPDQFREMTEADERRNIKECEMCKGNGTKLATFIRNHVDG